MLEVNNKIGKVFLIGEERFYDSIANSIFRYRFRRVAAGAAQLDSALLSLQAGGRATMLQIKTTERVTLPHTAVPSVSGSCIHQSSTLPFDEASNITCPASV